MQILPHFLASFIDHHYHTVLICWYILYFSAFAWFIYSKLLPVIFYFLRRRRRPPPLDPSIPESMIPSTIYSTQENLENSECCVCLEEFKDEDSVRVLPICNHIFHPECVDQWFLIGSTCPTCRVDLNILKKSTTQVATEAEVSHVVIQVLDDAAAAA